ncbi:phosphatase PAP2 family protein [Leekyejoonella antrihumi]|uniref:Phosphatase PAP2 family protein n=1 Tax=Leekyejoonella antrihumi TaxID=1660198 RepID=A0A563E2Q6_9MICO|nr:phosphatase PAP2 family protein [Leekyejoonella antrihumi]TWP36818.1 phosphatase PAP2 family protein [Leekyejoonella antrihumi]
MQHEALHLPAYNGSHIDGSIFTDVTNFARHTQWLNRAAEDWTTYSIGVFIILLLVGWWISRRKDTATMTAALVAPIAVLVAFLVTEIIKSQIAELRPCRSMPHAFIIESCPAPTDYAMPSGHTTFAVATAIALLIVNRKLGMLTLLLAILEGVSRVYVGAHYPHDVVAAFIVAIVVVIPVSLILRRLLVGLVGWLRRGPLRPLLLAA